MRPVTKRLLPISSLLGLLGLMAALLFAAPSPPRENPAYPGSSDLTRVQEAGYPIPPEIKPILVALRSGDDDGVVAAINQLTKRKGPGAFDRWLHKTLIKGRTRQEDVIRLFGKPHFDLDRPGRDQIVTIEYSLENRHTYGTTLVIDFDAKSRLLLHWGESYWICGFCPHVFADDGQWRLEGKLLAGCTGANREGADTLLLPRLTANQGQLRVKVSNLAPEVEYIDQIELGSVPLQDGEELDVAEDGRLFVWRPLRQLDQAAKAKEELALSLGRPRANRVLVIEARNTSAFESAMRESLFQKPGQPFSASLHVEFDRAKATKLQPVGTKFLRRIVVAVPEAASSVHLLGLTEYWLVRRIWLGSGRDAEESVIWQSPAEVRGPTPESRRLLLHADGERIRLEPGEEMQLRFHEPKVDRDGKRMGHVLRMIGYYEFLSSARSLEE